MLSARPPAAALRIGVDLGGTKTEAVVIQIRPGPEDSAGTEEPAILARVRRPTGRDLGYEHVLENTAKLIEDVAEAAGIAPRIAPEMERSALSGVPIGVGMPGSVTRRTGVVKNSNTTCLNGRPFRDDLRRRVGAPIAFANDANCFALAEARFGAGRDGGLVFGAILGTGVGGGIALRSASEPPRSWDGLQGIAGEWGHLCIEPTSGPPCYCGRRGCVETFLSGPALERAYRERTGEARPLAEIAARASAQPQDPDAAAVLDGAARMFGRAIALVIDVLDPDVIVLGGGVAHLECLYTDGVRHAAEWVFNDELLTPIRRYEIGDSAGVIGAALLAP